MKKIDNAILRSAFAIILGLVLVLWPGSAVQYLVVVIGVLFIVPGVISLVGYFTAKSKSPDFSPSFPIESAGSILFGLWLVSMPTFFVNILMYVLGVLLILAAIQQIVSLSSAKKWTTVPVPYYIFPILILLCGIVILAYPFTVAASAFMFLGVVILVYGAGELFSWYRFAKQKDSINKN
ncbi:HdeD family acid-resistance protein [Parabacteroides pacaensis]|uniref:HdeD family acid-resistance protein n=1 Tax=Parabacteroides pacaensis TaxID=2086575 RepID=UPI000D0F9610|nr:DUF308 domain-containing protein [Parabacteroides pacaensis]